MNRKAAVQGLVDILFGVITILMVVIFFILILSAQSDNNAETVTQEVTWEADYVANSLAKIPVNVDGTSIGLGEYLTSREADEDVLNAAFEEAEEKWVKDVDKREGYDRHAKLYLIQDGEVVYAKEEPYRFVDNDPGLQRLEQEIEDALKTGTLADIDSSISQGPDWPRGIVQLTGKHDAAIIVLFVQRLGDAP